jgi:hypothetical protein
LSTQRRPARCVITALACFWPPQCISRESPGLPRNPDGDGPCPKTSVADGRFVDFAS